MKLISICFNLLAFFLLSVLLSKLLCVLLDGYLLYQFMGLRISYLCGFASTILSTWFMMRFVNNSPFLEIGLSVRNHFTDIAAGMVWAVSIYLVGFLILIIFNQVSIDAIRFDSKSLSLSFIIYLVVAIKEEIAYRGYCLTILTKSMNKYAAVIIGSILFTFFHRNNADASYLSYMNIFLIGVFFSINYIYTHNLTFSIVLHWFWNWIQGPILGFGVSGNHNKQTLFQLSYPDGFNLFNGGHFGFEGSVVCTILSFMSIAVLYFWHQKKLKGSYW